MVHSHTISALLLLCSISLRLLLDLFQCLNILGIGGNGFLIAAVGIKGLVALVGDAFHLFVADAACIFQHGAVAKFEQAVHVLPPKIQRELLAFLGAQFGGFQKDDNQSVECIYFGCVEVVLGDDDVVLAHARAAPGGERHVGSAGIGARDDEFGGGLLGNGVEQFCFVLRQRRVGRHFRRPDSRRSRQIGRALLRKSVSTRGFRGCARAVRRSSRSLRGS